MKSVVILPAAGRSVRMGRPKLLLPFRGSTIIEQVLGTWRDSSVAEVLVVVRNDDLTLQEHCRRAGARVVTPAKDPREMRYSVQAGLEVAIQECGFESEDGWFLSPADVPLVSVDLIERLWSSFCRKPELITVPQSQGKRGHPVLFPGALASEVPALGADEGLNRLVERYPVQEIDWPHPEQWADVDTPEAYRRLAP